MDEVFKILIDYGYAVLFLWFFVKQFGAPLPGTPVQLAAGALVGLGELNFFWVLLITLAASTFGDTFMYALGRARGVRVLKFFCRIALEPDYCVRQTQNAFASRGASLLLYAKFVPGLSAVAQPLAGVEGISLRKFLIFNSLGTVLQAFVITALGYVFSNQLELVAARMAEAGTWFVALAAFALGAYLMWKYMQRRRFIRSLRAERISAEELKGRLDAGEEVFIVDLRRQIEFENTPETIPGALHVATEAIDSRADAIPRDRPIVLYCT